MDAVKSDAGAGSAGEEQVLATLLSAGYVKEGDLSRVRRVDDVASDGLLALLVRLGLVSERHFAEACVEALALRAVHDDDIPDLPPEIAGISLRFMKEFHVVPLADSGGELELLVAYPHNTYALDAVALATGRQVLLRIGLRSQIEVLIERWYGTGRSAMGEILEFTDDTAAEEPRW